MRAGGRPRTLTDHLAERKPAEVAQVLRRRPDLAHPKPAADLGELAQRAMYHASLITAIDATTLPENRLLQLVVCLPQAVPLDRLAAALPDGTSLDDVEPVLTDLEQSALVWRHEGRVYSSAALRQAMPTTLGPPAGSLVGGQTVAYLKAAIANVREAASSSRVDALPAHPGMGSKPPRKAELVDHLEELLATPGVIERVLATAPAAERELAERMAHGRPRVAAQQYMLYYSPHSTYYRQAAGYWLFERALLLPEGNTGAAVQPREVGVALRGGRPVADLALHPPGLVTGQVDPAAADVGGSGQAVSTLDALADLLERWSETPVKQLKAGGLGANSIRQTASALEVTPERAALLVELAHLAGLLDEHVSEHYERRKLVREATVSAGVAAATWLAQPADVRWRQLAAAWLRAAHWPSASGRKGDDGKVTVPVMCYQQASGAPHFRWDVLAGLGRLDGAPGTSPTELPATDVATLAEWVYWQRPQPWLNVVVADPATAIRWIHDEAEALGIAAQGRLTSFGRALVDGDPGEAERRFAAGSPDEAETFTLQADMTAVVVGRLGREALGELRLMAEVESTGAATTFRFSEASLRRALDAGRDGEAIRAFLRRHAAKGVPKALDYLVTDVARRHGHLVVGAAQSFVTADDPAVLADACSHRRSRKLGLRLLAPTVAVSDQPAAKVLTGLREAGFLPVVPGLGAEGAEGKEKEGVAPATEDAGAPGNVVALATRTGAGAERAKDLPEPFRQRGRPRAAVAPELTDEAAAAMAEAICAGVPVEPTFGDVDDSFTEPPLGRPPDLDFLDLPDDAPFGLGHGLDVADLEAGGLTPEAFGEIVLRATATCGVLGFALVDDDVEPLLLRVTGTGAQGEVLGVNLLDGTATVVDYADVGAVLEMGTMPRIDDPMPRRGGRRGRRRR